MKILRSLRFCVCENVDLLYMKNCYENVDLWTQRVCSEDVNNGSWSSWFLSENVVLWITRGLPVQAGANLLFVPEIIEVICWLAVIILCSKNQLSLLELCFFSESFNPIWSLSNFKSSKEALYDAGAATLSTTILWSQGLL